MTGSPGNRRERYRREGTDEIKRLAMLQLAESGSAGISLSAIARQMGMTGPALYRYFANRDALLTALIRDGYADLAQAIEQAATSGAALPPDRRLRQMAEAFRAWALADPHRYLLLFGTPVPGYQAPMDTFETAFGTLTVLSTVAAELLGSTEGGAPLRLATVLWTRMHGVVSLEVAGQFAHLDLDPGEFFSEEVESAVAQAGR
ncbi:TetR/AcrR family transcriptional regulator [Kineosporia sp. NBRC 101731]|uniref:TetR/AcrR family transcriptional regulator n=1 Tax=Kineosporia sp. NBRC 101731 TaxID=3032199 RepID=UPI0024A47B3F|nr:TetR/AcrR family transcriptional regulator [Kineosporia sp. NBRC 101731]GLY29894.1 TetR family transcriptional regulator [Kineosporia sp. NBRC 101731]